jgi:hypothetical protein
MAMPNYRRLGEKKSKSRKSGDGDTASIHRSAFVSALRSDPGKRARDKATRENALARPPEEIQLAHRPDRIGKYLTKYLDAFLFDEFSEAYLRKARLAEIW